MKRQINILETFDSDLQHLLARARVTPRLPDHLRARALSRAVAFLNATAGASSSTVTPHSRSLRLAFAVSLAFAGATGVAVGAISALLVRTPGASVPALPFMPDAPRPVVCEADSPQPHLPVPAKPTVFGEGPRGRPPLGARETYSAEVGLLQRAQVAYAGADFSGALALVREHERRFRNARLAEEREALRVRSLSGAGRAAEARDAAAAFADRFPHSVFLPSLQATPRPLE